MRGKAQSKSESDPIRDRFAELQLGSLHAIRRDRRLTQSARTVGSELADLVNFDKRYAFASISYLASKLGLNEKTVDRAVAQLVANGHFTVWRAGRSNRYVPRWLAGMDDVLSRGVWRKAQEAQIAAREKGPKMSPIGTRKGDIFSGDRGHFFHQKGTFLAPYPLITPLETPLGPDGAAPAAAGDLAAAATGAPPPQPQRELPLLRAFQGGETAPRPSKLELENAAHRRLSVDLLRALGVDGYAAVIGWATPELEARATEAEIERPGAGVALVIEAWRAHRDSMAPGEAGLAPEGRESPDRAGAGDAASASRPIKRAASGEG